jgi:hypothetical protein
MAEDGRGEWNDFIQKLCAEVHTRDRLVVRHVYLQCSRYTQDYISENTIVGTDGESRFCPNK